MLAYKSKSNSTNCKPQIKKENNQTFQIPKIKHNIPQVGFQFKPLQINYSIKMKPMTIKLNNMQ
jgi:hypothetical protein